MVTRKQATFKYGKEIKKSEIPAAAPNAVVSELPIWDEVDAALIKAKETGVVPFEEVLEYDISDFPSLRKLKQPRQSVLQAMRARVKKHDQQRRIEVQSRKDRIFLVVL